MFTIFYIGLGVAINAAIVVFGRSLERKRPKMSYTEYLDRYGRKKPYNSSDVHKFM